MYRKPVELQYEKHKDFTYAPVNNYSFARELMAVPVTIDELPEVAKYYPLIFTSGDFTMPHALLGLEQGKNSCVTPEGIWLMPYIPRAVLCYPFAITKKGEKNIISIDEEAPHFKQKGDFKLFENNGFSPFMENVVKFLEHFQQGLTRSAQAAGELVEKGVLVEQTLQVRHGGRAFGVSGCRIISRERLKDLNDSTLATWVRQGLTAVIELHLASLANLQSLARLHRAVYYKDEKNTTG